MFKGKGNVPHPLDASHQLRPRVISKKEWTFGFLALTLICSLVFLGSPVSWCIGLGPCFGDRDKEIQNCPQAMSQVPHVHAELWNSLGAQIQTDAFKTVAFASLAGAVQIPTESFDGMGPVGEDPRWDVFLPFRQYLRKSFPMVHASLTLTNVNTHGLWYEWKGSNSSLKPILLAAHQDVVPVEPTTIDRWTHGPYSGYFDGQRIWGRGSSDDKGSLIAILTSVETLLLRNFQPERTVVLAFGFDEEASGTEGAGHLSEVLLEAYGEDAFAFVIDEGGKSIAGGFGEEYGTVFATPAVAEKGYLDVRVQVNTPGGHSSVPPVHTAEAASFDVMRKGIGILSAALVQLEANPFEVTLTRDNPFFKTLQCAAEHGKGLPKSLKKTIKRAAHSDKALRDLTEVVNGNSLFRSLVGTTQAIDLIEGGVKVNALPEQASAVMNHRISAVSSVEATKARDTRLLEPIARKFNLTYIAFGSALFGADFPSSGNLTLSEAFYDSLEPAPVTPTGLDAAPYQLLSGTIKATYNAHREIKGDHNVVVSPGMSTGNTDTRFYWQLSRHIFRYDHSQGGGKDDPLGGIHTVNEYIRTEAYLETIRFYITLILNADESQTI